MSASSATTFLISAGHGGTDPGAVSSDGQHREADLALRLRDRVAGLLRVRGLAVVEDGEDKKNQPLAQALNYSRNMPGALKLEFHFNAGPPTATGVEALSLGAQKPLAQALAQAVSAATGLVARGDKGWKPDNSGQHKSLAFCRLGGVILELAFISNERDMSAYLASEVAVATAIADALARFAR